jgi:hypothetical protein
MVAFIHLMNKRAFPLLFLSNDVNLGASPELFREVVKLTTRSAPSWDGLMRADALFREAPKKSPERFSGGQLIDIHTERKSMEKNFVTFPKDWRMRVCKKFGLIRARHAEKQRENSPFLKK